MKKKHTAQLVPFVCPSPICLALFYAAAMSAHASIITVTNTHDSGSGSLRQALRVANDGDTVNFAVTGTITLTSGGLPVNKSLDDFRSWQGSTLN